VKPHEIIFIFIRKQRLEALSKQSKGWRSLRVAVTNRLETAPTRVVKTIARQSAKQSRMV